MDTLHRVDADALKAGTAGYWVAVVGATLAGGLVGLATGRPASDAVLGFLFGVVLFGAPVAGLVAGAAAVAAVPADATAGRRVAVPVGHGALVGACWEGLVAFAVAIPVAGAGLDAVLPRDPVLAAVTAVVLVGLPLGVVLGGAGGLAGALTWPAVQDLD
jgi:hypothetical protein